jgi:hypothetical protein
MRLALASLVVLSLGGVARADTLKISADTPTAGLPALSRDGTRYARPVIVQPSGCTGTQTFVEVGTVGSDTVDSRGTLYLVRDQCSKTADAKAAGNLDTVNKALADDGYHTVGTMQSRAVPSDIDTPSGTVHVGTSGNACTVAMSGSQADHWQVMLDGPVTEVHGWYTGKNAAGASYVSVLVTVKAKDTGDKGRERWLDFWPVEQPTEAGPGTPAQVGARWIEALKAHDVKDLSELISPPFWKVGFHPISGALKKSCKHKDTAKRPSDIATVARCIASGSSDIYGKYPVGDNVSETDMTEFPDELRKYKKKVTKMVHQGYKLVQYKINEDGVLVYVELLLDPDTDFQLVGAALESINVD